MASQHVKDHTPESYDNFINNNVPWLITVTEDFRLNGTTNNDILNRVQNNYLKLLNYDNHAIDNLIIN